MSSSSSTTTSASGNIFLKNLGIGATSGAIAACTIFPLDLLKTKIQSGAAGKGMIDIVKETIHPSNGGFRALYRGLAPNLVGIMPEKAIKLSGMFKDDKMKFEIIN